MTRRGLRIAVLACAAVLAAPALGGAGVLPSAMTTYLLGSKMIRAEILVIKGNGTQQDFRLDRGRLVKRYAAGSLSLLERDGTKTTVKVASSARVILNGKPVTVNVRRLRAGMQIAVSHVGDLPAVSVYATTGKTAPKWPVATGVLLLGNKLVRGEIVLQDTAPHDYRLDHGRIKQVGLTTLVLREADGTDVSIEVSPTAHVKLNGQNANYFQLRKGMMATTIRDGDKPADQIFATGR